MAGVIQQQCLHDEVAIRRQFHFAAEQALGIGDALAEVFQRMGFIDMLVGV